MTRAAPLPTSKGEFSTKTKRGNTSPTIRAISRQRPLRAPSMPPPFSGSADILTGKSARYDVNKAAPRAAVKGANVIPNRERRENAVILSGGKYACGVGFALDGADGAPAEQVSTEYATTSARE
jgi:hypothetical protein